jgi:ABC-type thiamine transport system ATPase subunit
MKKARNAGTTIVVLALALGFVGRSSGLLGFLDEAPGTLSGPKREGVAMARSTQS